MALPAETALGQQAHVLTVLVLVTLPIAWIHGRGPERKIAAAATLVIGLDLLRQKFLAGWGDMASFRLDHALLDLLVLTSLGAIALRANRLYPLVMTGAALIAVLAHGLRWLGLMVKRHERVDETHATVAFVARSKLGAKAHRLHETSRFELSAAAGEPARWLYVDGDLHAG